jgi:hypothetical protein
LQRLALIFSQLFAKFEWEWSTYASDIL